MEKLIYVLCDAPERAGSDIRTSLIDGAALALRRAGAREIQINVQDEHVAAGAPMRQQNPPIRATVSFWMECADDRTACEQTIAQHAARIAGYLVTESRPLVHARPAGGRTPGMSQVTCITRRPDLTWDDFLHIWHEDHRVVAVETQSTTGYVRNVVVRKLTPEAPAWHGIVEEIFPIEALTDPLVFYAAKDEGDYKRRLTRMVESVGRFLDLAKIEYTHMSEYYLG
jgi:hypothetical protein